MEILVMLRQLFALTYSWYADVDAVSSRWVVNFLINRNMRVCYARFVDRFEKSEERITKSGNIM
jgi:hypothetical protein